MSALPLDARHAEKRVKTLFGWLFFRRLSLPLSMAVARTRISPSQVTAFGLICGLTGAGLIASGRYAAGVAGGVLAILAKLADAMDGEVARARHVETSAGYVADGLVDRVRDTALVAGCGVAGMRMDATGASGWTIAALAFFLLFFYVSGASPAHWREVRTEADLDDKHMFHAGRLRLGAGDTLAVAVLTVTLAGHPVWLVQAIAVAAPVALALKTRRLFRLRPFERDDAPAARP